MLEFCQSTRVIQFSKALAPAEKLSRTVMQRELIDSRTREPLPANWKKAEESAMLKESIVSELANTEACYVYCSRIR
jgi:hypothetical protein